MNTKYKTILSIAAGFLSAAIALGLSTAFLALFWALSLSLCVGLFVGFLIFFQWADSIALWFKKGA